MELEELDLWVTDGLERLQDVGKIGVGQVAQRIHLDADVLTWHQRLAGTPTFRCAPPLRLRATAPLRPPQWPRCLPRRPAAGAG